MIGKLLRLLWNRLCGSRDGAATSQHPQAEKPSDPGATPTPTLIFSEVPSIFTATFIRGKRDGGRGVFIHLNTSDIPGIERDIAVCFDSMKVAEETGRLLIEIAECEDEEECDSEEDGGE